MESPFLKILMASIRPMLKDFRIEIDTDRQVVTVHQATNVVEMTYEQFILKIKELLP